MKVRAIFETDGTNVVLLADSDAERRVLAVLEGDVTASVILLRERSGYGDARLSGAQIVVKPAGPSVVNELVASLQEALRQWNVQFEGEQDNDPWCIAARAAIARVPGSTP